jgi:hypothetical protein
MFRSCSIGGNATGDKRKYPLFIGFLMGAGQKMREFSPKIWQ